MWDKELERHDRTFLDLKDKIYLDMFPHNEGVFENNMAMRRHFNVFFGAEPNLSGCRMYAKT